MKRRDVIKALGASAVALPAGAYISPLNAQTSYTGKVLFSIYAAGGIDQSSWVDPRMNPAINTYATPGSRADIGVAGNIRFAPLANNAAFWQKYARHTLVLNGLDFRTIDHGAGTIAGASGRLERGYPTLAELFAFNHGRGLPMRWLNEGAVFTSPVGLVPPTPMPSAANFRSLLLPNASYGDNTFMKQGDVDKVLAARAERMRAMKSSGTLTPRKAAVADQFLAAAESRALLARVAAFMPAQIDFKYSSAHVGLIAAQAGITASVHISSGGFDTHFNHTPAVSASLTRLYDTIDFIWTTAAKLNLDRRLIVRVYTDFGRTLLTNNDGKDHYRIGSEIIMEADAPWANRVVGASGPLHQQARINRRTGQLTTSADPDAIVLTPTHVHDALRRYMNLSADARFDLQVPDRERIDLFNPSIATGYPTMT
jgi:uncharacterized protein (DUF1501 family)